jgi:hypothetical protein
VPATEGAASDQEVLEPPIGVFSAEDSANFFVIVGVELANEIEDQRRAQVELFLVRYLDVFLVVDVVREILVGGIGQLRMPKDPSRMPIR